MNPKLVENKALNWHHSVFHKMDDGTFYEQKMPYKCDHCDEPAKYNIDEQLVCFEHYQKISFAKQV